MLRQALADAALAGAHQPDQDDRAVEIAAGKHSVHPYPPYLRVVCNLI
jgi:hypothetical protein